MKFIHLTDTHIRKAYEEEGFDKMLKGLKSPADNLAEMCMSIKWDDIGFVAITGDLVHEGNHKDYKYLKQLLDTYIPSEIEVICTLGNHDYKEPFYLGFHNEDSSDEYYYKRVIAGYRLIVLDSAVPGKESGTISQNQIKWLAHELKKPAEKGTLLFLHHPIIWGNELHNGMEISNSNEVMEVIKKSDVIAVFSGHTHTNAVNVKNGCQQYTADSLAFSLEINKNDEVSFTDKTGYSIVEINEANVTAHCGTIYKGVTALQFPLTVFSEQLKELDA